MRTFFLFAGVAALTAALPSAAEAQGRGNGRGGPSVRAEQQTRVNTNRGRARADIRTQARVDAERRPHRDRARTVERNYNGIDDRDRFRFVDRNRDGVDDRAQNQYGGGVCPPGLANRAPACVPPGQARRMFREGQRIPTNYGAFTRYNDLPPEFRDRIPTGYNYIYRDNSVYVVDPQTRLVTSIINLLGL